jgi:hypothetical protein
MIAAPLTRVVTLVFVVATAAPSPPARASATEAGTIRPSLFNIPLQAQALVKGAKGVALLHPARTPFGMPLTVDGNFIFEAEVSVAGLPAAAQLGPYTTYAVWATNGDLTETRLLGTLRDDQPTRGKVYFSKFLIVVTAENGIPGPKWRGPVLLRGFSPSNYLENFAAKTLMNGGQIPPQ